MVMTPGGRVGRGVPSTIVLALLASLAATLLAAASVAADWTTLKRVTDERGSRLDSLHQLAADRGIFHIVHPRIGPGATDDRVFYQRSDDQGETWSQPWPLFQATTMHRQVVPNLALDASRETVAVVWRVSGPEGHAMLLRVSRDGGRTFGKRKGIVSTKRDHGIGVPAVAVDVGGRVIVVAWTDRHDRTIMLRSSRDGGRTFGDARSVGRTNLSIDCRRRLTDGLVGLAASLRSIHVAWSDAPTRRCQASRIQARRSGDHGRTWEAARTVTARRSYGWPELDARGRTVMATVQAPGGDVIVARSGNDGASWADRLLKAPRGANFSAADVVLLPERKAMITYVNERIRRARLLATKVVSRWSPDDGTSLRRPRTVAGEARRLRIAPNIAGDGEGVSIVLQSGPLSGLPRNVFVSRLR
jgi:hypothetical protein